MDAGKFYDPTSDHYGIELEISEGSNVNTATAYESQSSGAQTPLRSKKRVNWDLPQIDGADEERDDPSADAEPRFRDEDIVALRRQLSSSLPSPPTEPCDHDRENTAMLASPPRGVLRSGISTPLQHDEHFNDTETQDPRVLSAINAQRRAYEVNEDVSRSSSPHKRRQHQRHRSLPQRYFQTTVHLHSGTATPEECSNDFVPAPERWRIGGLSGALSLAGRLVGGTPSQSRRSSFDSTTSTIRVSPGTLSPRNNSVPSITDFVGRSTMFGAIGRNESAQLWRNSREDLLTSYTEGHSKRWAINSDPRSLLIVHRWQLVFRDSHLTSCVSSDIISTANNIRSSLHRPTLSRSSSSGFFDTVNNKLLHFKSSKHERRQAEKAYITKHIQETALRQRYLIKLCRALMQYGAPTHRLEEYMKMSARVLETEAQFLYIPGCMIISFDDSRTHTTEMKLVRTNQGVDLGKLKDTHDVYKDVVHDETYVSEATERLDTIMNKTDKFHVWFRVMMYGVASASVGPFAFGARLIDMPIAFLLGSILGFLQLVLSGQNDLYTSVFEIVAVLVTSFLARAFGSIQNGNLFCFSALAQSSIALILPGYTVLCGALELQAKSIVAGAVRLVYAIIYALFLGFGLTMGIAIYGAMDKKHATSATTCQKPLSDDSYWVFLFVPLFSFCLMVVNQAKWKQMPLMLIIAFAGYVVNYFSAVRFVGNPQISSAFGSFAIAFLANMHTRLGHRTDAYWKAVVSWIERRRYSQHSKRNARTSTPIDLEASELKKTQHDPATSQAKNNGVRVTYSLAAASMLPAIFVQVPSGLSVSGSLVQSIQTSDQIVQNGTGTTLTQGDVYTGQYSSSALDNSIALTVGYSVVQIAIGITVGLFLGTLLAYPTGKGGQFGARKVTRSGIFSF